MSSVIHTVIRSLNEERRRAGLVFLFDDIACTPHGVNEFDILAFVYLLAEISDIYVDNIRAALVVVVPDVILNFLAAEYNALVHHKILQQLIFLCRERYLPARAFNAPRCRVDCQVADGNYTRLFSVFLRVMTRSLAESSSNENGFIR